MQDVIDGYLKPMRSHDWDRGMLLSMRSTSFPESFPYQTITVPVKIIIGEKDTFLLKTANKVLLEIHPPTLEVSEIPPPLCAHTPLFNSVYSLRNLAMLPEHSLR